MVRRLTKNVTGNKSLSKYDYQNLEQRNVIYVLPKEDKFIFFKPLELPLDRKFILSMGFYAKCKENLYDSILSVNANKKEIIRKSIRMDTKWNRYFCYVELKKIYKTIEVKLDIPDKGILIWGFNIQPINIDIMKQRLDVQSLSKKELKDILNNNALLPEVIYIEHDKPFINVRILNEDKLIIEKSSENIFLKYCSLCDRLLPAKGMDNERLAFHKHKPQSNGGFRSGFQLECRACKNRNINRKLNPKRTSDQFFESSLLSRERSAFLEQPEIFDIIQKKYKKHFLGFKAAVWEKFGKRCFNCGKPLKLNEVQLDHTRPMSLFWPLDEYATGLCFTCNNSKRDRHPSDFYSKEKLKELSKITGLDLEQLEKKEFNPKMLNKILSNIEKYSNEWSPNFFFNTRFRILEFHPDIDILKIYENKTGKKYSKEIIKLVPNSNKVLNKRDR